MIIAFSKNTEWIKEKNAQDSNSAICGWKKTRAKSVLLLKNQLLIWISEILKERNSNEKLIFDEKRASRSTFAPQKSIKIWKAESRARSLLLTENGAGTRKWCFLWPFWASKWTKKDEFIVLRSLMWRKYCIKTARSIVFWRMSRTVCVCVLDLSIF